MAKRPEHRFASMTEVEERLVESLGRPEAPVHRTRAFARHVPIAVGALVGVVGIALGFGFARHSSAPLASRASSGVVTASRLRQVSSTPVAGCAIGQGPVIAEASAVAACIGTWKGDVSTAQNLCAPDWHVCRGTEPGIRTMTFDMASSVNGCFAFDAAQDSFACWSGCSSAVARGVDTAENVDMGGVGRDCPYRHETGWSCLASGRVNASENSGTGCAYNPKLTGVVCCPDGAPASPRVAAPADYEPTITTLAPVLTDGFAVLPEGDIIGCDHARNEAFRVHVDGSVTPFAGGGHPADGIGDGMAATKAALSSPINVARAADGSVYVAEWGTNVVRRITPDGRIEAFAGVRGAGGFGGDGGQAREARFNAPTQLTVVPDGSLLVADTGNRRIRRVRPDGVVETVAGSGQPGTGGDGGPAIAAQLTEPESVLSTRDGTLYIEDKSSGRVRTVDGAGIIRTLVADLTSPSSIALGSDGTLYVTETTAHRILAIGPGGARRVVAGTGEPGYRGDGGRATAALLKYPGPIRLSADERTLFVSDAGNRRIRAIALAPAGPAEP
jgi:sugar lactone lactonase YvrE